MSVFERKTKGSFLKRSVLIGALALLMAPSAAVAEPLLMLHNGWDRFSVPDAELQQVKRPVDIALNNGGLVIRCSDVLLAFAYKPPINIIEPREKVVISERPDCRSSSGISLRISFLF